jgi:thioredoxin 1
MDWLKSLFDSDRDETATAVAEQERGPAQAPAQDVEPIHVTDDTFEEVVLGAPIPALVDFWAPWCGPCRMVAPIVEELARDYDGQLRVAKVNTDENVEVASRLGIMGIPTVILFKNGQEVDRIVGFAPRHAMEERLEAVLEG